MTAVGIDTHFDPNATSVAPDEISRRLESLPAFMAHLDDVTMTSPSSSHWRATAPFGKTVEWDAVLTDDLPGERIAWRSVNGVQVTVEGSEAAAFALFHTPPTVPA